MESSESGFAPIGGAQIYYEIAGSGDPFVMIHAGVADSRQWSNEFAFFMKSHRVLRYDLRGYGRSEPVEGDFSHIDDLASLLDHVHVNEPLILMGCSMGGSLAMDYALASPTRVKALIIVDSGPSGLELDVPMPAKAADAEKAYNEGDLDLVAEIETQIWFDGMGRTPQQVDQSMRRLVYDMNRRGLELDSKHLGKCLPNAPVTAAGRLHALKIPVLIIIGVHDTPFILAASDYMMERLPTARKFTIPDAAHLPNLDHPKAFQEIVSDFLNETLHARSADSVGA